MQNIPSKTSLETVQISSPNEIDDEVHGATEDKAEVAEAGGAEDPGVGDEAIWTPEEI